MMAALSRSDGLIDRLPKVRGRLTANAPIGSMTWFRVGGPAEVLYKPADRDDLARFLAGCPDDVPITVIGVASNLIIRDGGVPGVVIRLGRGFTGIEIEDNRIHAGAAALDINVARACAQAEVAGLEFLAGIPGTIGGALRMNAGAYGREIADVLEGAEILDRAGRRRWLKPAQLGMSYRHTDAPDEWIFVRCILTGEDGEEPVIAERIAEIQRARQETQPIRQPTGGSTFANPPGNKAWELIDAAGCRGLMIGGAQVSEKHCNFLINTGSATAADLEALGDEVRRRVFDHSGIELRWEIRRVGVPAREEA